MPDATATRPIRFFHRGQVHSVAGLPPTRTLLQWLREDARCTGTKEGCAEGDCGACTVVVGRLDEAGALQLQPVNACIRLLASVDGAALFAVEDIAGADGALHPVQQAMVEHHGSQCGFCTPGFVMTMWCGYQQACAAAADGAPPAAPSRQALADALSGNLCRCTGYRPILDAGEAAYRAPRVALDPAPVVAALKTLQPDPPLALTGLWQPQSLAELAALRLQQPQARLTHGSTDVGLWITKQLKTAADLGGLIDLTRVTELARITRAEPTASEPGWLHIGAGASLEDAWAALAAEWPALREVWLRFASPPVRAAGTLGGNVANGSPIGDGAPVLMALDAQLLLRRGEAQRRLPLHGFYTGYQKNRLEAGEFLEAIEVPLPPTALPAPERARVQAYKISKRYDSDITAVLAALAVELDAQGLVRAARLVFGGMAATVQRAAGAEAALVGRPWTSAAESEAALAAAQAALAQDFRPLSDHRASAGYRQRVAGNLLRRFWLQTRADAPLPAEALNVRAALL